MRGKAKAIRRRKAQASHIHIEIRGMRLEDLSAVFALGQRLFTAEDLPTLYRCWDDDEVMQLFASDEETCLVAEADGRIVGFALGGIMEKRRSAWRYGWLEWLGVDPAFKRHGVATRLLNHLTGLFIRLDARIMLVDTDEDNRDALAFFKKNGFGQEVRHIYLSRNLDDDRRAMERREHRDEPR